jgi:uncharacterized membrane protein YkvA (DUF1232 family)
VGAVKTLRGLKVAADRIRSEIRVYKLVWKHPRTPRRAKVLLGSALAYAVSPIDVIPDFIPFLGQLDDALIVTGLVKWALKMIPKDVIDECRREAGAV